MVGADASPRMEVTIMEASAPRSRLGRPNGMRAGVIIGLAFALVGAAVGTATGAVTPFQQVLVVNPAASPVQVTGTVSVSNTPANQNVTVTNLPATQPVSGTVNVGNLPAVQLATKSYSEIVKLDPGAIGEFSFGGTINVSTLIVSNTDDDSLTVFIDPVGSSGNPIIYQGDGGTTQNFATPIPATKLFVFCLNDVFDCAISIAVFGS